MQKHQDLKAKEAQGILGPNLGLTWPGSNLQSSAKSTQVLEPMPSQGKEQSWQLRPSECP